MGKSDYEAYRRRLEREGRIALWALLIVGLVGVAFAVIHGIRTGFTQGELAFTIIFGLFVAIDAFFLSPIYRYLAAALVRRRQRLRGDRVDVVSEESVVRLVDTKSVEHLFKEESEAEGER